MKEVTIKLTDEEIDTLRDTDGDLHYFIDGYYAGKWTQRLEDIMVKVLNAVGHRFTCQCDVCMNRKCPVYLDNEETELNV